MFKESDYEQLGANVMITHSHPDYNSQESVGQFGTIVKRSPIFGINQREYTIENPLGVKFVVLGGCFKPAGEPVEDGYRVKKAWIPETSQGKQLPDRVRVSPFKPEDGLPDHFHWKEITAVVKSYDIKTYGVS